MESTICHFEIPARDLERARTFYGGLFGWTIREAPGMNDSYLFIQTAERADSLGGAIRGPQEEGQGGVTLYVTVLSLDSAVRKLQELGGTVMVPRTALPGLGWTVVARDPEGNSLGLFEEDADAA